MTKTSVSLAALMVMAACSATASPNVAAAPSPVPMAVEAAVATPAPQATAAAAAATPTRVTYAAQRVVAPTAPQPAAAIACDVRARRTANGLLIQAVARADRAFDGEYELVITKNGGAGFADVTQSGPVSVAAGESVTLGSTELGADGRYRAVLTLSDGSGEVCRLERGS